MHRYKITFAYDGSNFAGFQVQPGERTVQQVLERAVNKIAKKPQPPLMDVPTLAFTPSVRSPTLTYHTKFRGRPWCGP